MHHWMIFFVMICWMVGPLAVYGVAPKKNRDPYLWVFGSAILGPLVPLVFFILPPARLQEA
ncbi:MAG: hypothetical protein ACK46X_16770 [Candidatus Sericytochromatia bacterium]